MLGVEVALEARDEPHAVLRDRLRRLVAMCGVRLGLVVVIVAAISAPLPPSVLRQNVLRKGRGEEMCLALNPKPIIPRVYRGNILNPKP